MFETFFRVQERCPRCNFPIQREEGHWLGAIGINMIVTLTLLFVTMLVSFLLTIEERRAVRVLIPCLLVACLTPSCSSGARTPSGAPSTSRCAPSNPATTSTHAGSRHPCKRRW